MASSSAYSPTTKLRCLVIIETFIYFSWQPITHINARNALKDETQKTVQFPDSIQRTLDICAKAIIVIPAGAFFISIGCNAAFFAGVGVGLSSIPFSIHDFIMAFRMWFEISILLLIIYTINNFIAKFLSLVSLFILKQIYKLHNFAFLNKLILFLTRSINRLATNIVILMISIITIFTFSFMKGEVYPGNYGLVYTNMEIKNGKFEVINGSIISLDKGVIVKNYSDNATFIFNGNIKKIEYKIYANSFFEKLMNSL